MVERKIIGFRADETGDWIAELDCGHNQHVRHNPPWLTRDWVLTAAGRKKHLGHALECLSCIQSFEPSDWKHKN